MKAVQIHNYGGVDTLMLEDAPRPEPAEGDLLIRVHATTVNPFDCVARAGYVTSYYPYDMPVILGLDVSGVVEQIGAGVEDFTVGEAVYARGDPALNGAYAEYMVVSAIDAAPKPSSLSHIQAAALPHVGLTAWRVLMEAANLSAGQTVLIHAAAGGVGSFSVQLAKWLGARVIGTASSYNHEFLRELGADELVDYNTVPFEQVVQGVDVVFDTIGGDTQERSFKTLKPGGVLVSVISPPSDELAAAHGVRGIFTAAYPPAGEVLKKIGALVEAGHIKPVVSNVYMLDEIRKAHTQVETRHTRGKLVLQVAG